jgi:cytochrome c oxidase assembly protein subunit 15
LQWALELPAALVWVHVALATLTWVAMLWTVATAGLLEPRRAPAPARDRGRAQTAGV